MNIGDRTYAFQPLEPVQDKALLLSPLKMQEIMQTQRMTVQARLIAPDLVATSLAWGNTQIQCDIFVPGIDSVKRKLVRKPELDPHAYYFKITRKQGKEQYLRHVEKIIKKVESLFACSITQMEIAVYSDAFEPG